MAFFLQAGSHSTANSMIHALHEIFLRARPRGAPHAARRPALHPALRARELPASPGESGGLAPEGREVPSPASASCSTLRPPTGSRTCSARVPTSSILNRDYPKGIQPWGLTSASACTCASAATSPTGVSWPGRTPTRPTTSTASSRSWCAPSWRGTCVPIPPARGAGHDHGSQELLLLPGAVAPGAST